MRSSLLAVIATVAAAVEHIGRCVRIPGDRQSACGSVPRNPPCTPDPPYMPRPQRSGLLEVGVTKEELASFLNNGSRPPDVEEAIARRSEEHTSELQSRQYLVCRLLLEKKTNR